MDVFRGICESAAKNTGIALSRGLTCAQVPHSLTLADRALVDSYLARQNLVQLKQGKDETGWDYSQRVADHVGDDLSVALKDRSILSRATFLTGLQNAVRRVIDGMPSLYAFHGQFYPFFYELEVLYTRRLHERVLPIFVEHLWVDLETNWNACEFVLSRQREYARKKIAR